MPAKRLFLALIFTTSISSLAQIDRATLTGTIADATGAVLTGAKVAAINTDTRVAAESQSNAEGLYSVPGLIPGTYTVTISHDGFATAKFNDLVLEVGETRTLNIRLQVGAVTQTLAVEGTLPLDTTPAWSGVIDQKQLETLPVNGRNWATLLTLAPGAIDDGGGDQRTIRFAGRGRDDNNYTMDGIDATGIQEQAQKSSIRLQLSQEAISEYRVSSALYDTQHGAGAGGQIDLVSKTGTNNFHGSVFEYLRNSSLDARAFNDFDPVTNQPVRPPFRLNQFGLSLGGPIVKDKTFFFLSYEGLRQFQSRTQQGFVPSIPLRQAILANSPQMSPIVDAFPVGNVQGTCNDLANDPCIDQFVHQAPVKINEDSWLIRIDHRFSERTALYGRATRDVAFSSAPLNALFDQQQIINHPANYVVSLAHSFSPSLFNEAKFGINRSPFHNPQVSVLPYAVATDNFTQLNNGNTDNEVGTTFNYIDNLAIVHGRHTFKTGIEIRRVRLNQGITADNNYNFTDNASLINNQLDSVANRNSWYPHGLRHTFVLPYFQDEWKLRRNLTLNLGLRWEYYSVITEAHGKMTVFDSACVTGGIEPGICPHGSPAYFPNYRNLDPRIGVAWAPESLHEKTVVRAGFGIYHGAGQNDDLNASLESDTTRINVSNVDIPNLSFPFDASTLPPGDSFYAPRGLQRHRRDLYVEQWGLSVEQQLPAEFVAHVSYIGTHGVRLFARSYTNLCAEYDASTTCTRQFPNLDVVDIKRDVGTSSFNALDLSLERRFTQGWLLQAHYLWSHSINDGSVGGGESNAPENPFCVPCDRGPSIYDIRQNFVATSVYDLPMGPGRSFLGSTSGFVGKLLEGWTLSGNGIFHTGHPLTPLMGISSSQTPYGTPADQRPDLVPGVSVIPANQRQAFWINANAYAQPPLIGGGVIAHFGNSPRGTVRAPRVWQLDLALAKDTRLTERLVLQFRAEAFNITNRLMLGDPGQLDILAGDPSTGGTFGVITTDVNYNNNNDNFAPPNTGSGLPRQIEFMLRLKF